MVCMAPALVSQRLVLQIDYMLIVLAGFRMTKVERLASSAIGGAMMIVARRLLHPFLFARLDSNLVPWFIAFFDAMGPKAVPACGPFDGCPSTVMEDRADALGVDARQQVVDDVITIFALSEHKDVFVMDGSGNSSVLKDGALFLLFWRWLKCLLNKSTEEVCIMISTILAISSRILLICWSRLTAPPSRLTTQQMVSPLTVLVSNFLTCPFREMEASLVSLRRLFIIMRTKNRGPPCLPAAKVLLVSETFTMRSSETLFWKKL